MSSQEPGTSISDSEVTNISSLGFWLLVDAREYFVPFALYPVFEKASVPQIFSVKRIAPGQLYWPELDADIELEALESPEDYPLGWRE